MISDNVKRFCCEDISLIENYEKAIADTTQYWPCHHRLETHYLDGRRRTNELDITVEELKARGLYYNRPAKELIFLTNHEHSILHQKTRDERGRLALGEVGEIYRQKLSKANTGRHHTEETKEKIRQAALNMSDEHRRKISEGLKGRKLSPESCAKIGWYHRKENRSEETQQETSDSMKKKWQDPGYRKKCSDSHKGKTMTIEQRKKLSESCKLVLNSPEVQDKLNGLMFFNNGIVEIRAKECPEGFVRGKLSGMKFFNNGIKCIKAKECPVGFVPGRLKRT